MRVRRAFVQVMVVLGLVVSMTVGAAGLATAQEPPQLALVVDQEADEVPDPGNQCTAAPGDCSLRQAVDAAVDGDTITIEHLVDPQITLGQIDITEDLTIVGEGGATDGEPLEFNPGTRLDAAHGSRIFDVAAGADLVLSDLLLQRGEAPAGEDGGAVRNAGNLRLERVTVTNSRTTGAGDGGGIWSSGSLTATDVVFAGVIALANTAPNSAGGDGGAIASTGSLSLDRATFDRNTAGGADGGGAIAVIGGTAEVVNTTFFGNKATGGIGGALHIGGGGQASLISSTVAKNEAASGGGVGAVGGAALEVEATWFQDNLPDTCSGSVTAGADTLVWPADPACPATATVAQAWTATATPAAPSGLGGTFAPIIRIVQGSPAIDAIPAPGGVCSLGAHADQREIARPFGAGCDIGAYEAIEDLFVAFDPNLTAVTRTFLDGEERDIPLYAANTGTRTAVGVQVQLTFPAGVTVHSVTPPAGTTYDAGTGVWTVGDILPNGQTEAPLTLRLSRDAPGDHVVTAEISSDEPGTAETGTLTVHEPTDRYAVVGGPASGDCLTLATGCAIEYAVELAAMEFETIFVAPGEHVIAASLGVTNKSIVALDPNDRPTIRADFPGGMATTSGTVRVADVDFVNTDAGLSTSGAANATLERVTVRAARRALFTGNGSLTFRDSVLEAVGGSPSGQPFHQALVLAAPATIENVTVVGRGTGAILARTSGQTHSLANVIARDLDGGLDLAADAGVTVNLTSSNYGTTGGAGTITPAGTADNQTDAPVFIDTAGHDFRQATGSPTIDAGTGTPDAERRDFEGGPRVFGTSVDIGGDEHGPIAQLTPTSHDYGTVTSGATASHAFTVTNIGTAPLSVSSFTLTGVDAGQFAITVDDCDLALDPQDTCAIAVQFAPTAAGAKAASLDVVTTGGTDSAALTGTGEVPPDTTPPEITVTITPGVPASGWHTTDVTVTWSVVDDESEVTATEGCGAVTITADGVLVLPCSATSAGGTSTNSVTIKRDATRPTVTASVVPAEPSPSGWYLVAPTVSFACVDATSGVLHCPGPVTLDSSPSYQVASGIGFDHAGNFGRSLDLLLLVDLVDPTVTCSAAPTFTAGQTGATVSATVTDEHSGPEATPVSAPADTSAAGSFTVPVTGADVAGRTTTVDCPYTVSDDTGPEITATITPGAPPSGWHTTDVGVSWSVVDDESEVTSTEGCDNVSVITDGTFLITCKATSAGGESSNSVTIKRDATEPTISGSVTSGTLSPSGWYVTAPTVTFVCDDATSLIASCTAPTTLDSSATAQSVTGEAVDNAGNTAQATVGDLRVDLVDPTVVCAATPTFTVGQSGAVVSASVNDEHSRPVATTVTGPANTSTAGNSTAPVVGTDNAGRSTTVQCPYVVQRAGTTLQVHPAITISASPLRISINLNLSATLRRADTGAPIAGQPVTFRIGGAVACTATTNSQGKAMCGGAISFVQAVLGGSYTATYAGNATYQPSTASGPIL